MTTAKVMVRNAANNSILHEYTPISTKVWINGKKKADELECRLPLKNIINTGDIISYISDSVNLDNCSAIWNFQLSCLDERGYNYDSVDVVESRFSSTMNGKFQGSYQLDFTAAGQEITILNSAGSYVNAKGDTITNALDLSGQFDIYIWFTPDLLPYVSATTPILFSRIAANRGLEIGITKPASNWYVTIKVGDGTTTTQYTGTTAVVFDASSAYRARLIRVKRGSDNIIRMYANGSEDATATGVISASLHSSTANILFGTGSAGTEDYKGKLNQIKVYSGATLSDTEHNEILISKFTPRFMLFGGKVWKKEDSSTYKTVRAESFAKDLNNFMVTPLTFTAPPITGVNRSDVGNDNGFKFITSYYMSNQFGANNEAAPSGIAWKADGNKFFLLGGDLRQVTQFVEDSSIYGAAKTFDLTKLLDTNALAFSTEVTVPRDLFLSSDEKRLAVLGSTEVCIHQLKTAFDTTTVNNNTVTGLSVASPAVITTSAAHNFVTGDPVFISNLGSSPTVNGNRTVTFQSSTTFSVGVNTTSVSDSSGDANGRVTYNFSAQTSSASGVTFKSDGTVMYISDSNSIYRYDLPNPWNLAAPTYINSVNISAFLGESIRGIYMRSSGTTLLILGIRGIYRLKLSTAYDLTSTITLTDYYPIPLPPGVADLDSSAMHINSAGLRMWICDKTTGVVAEYAFEDAFSISPANWYHQNTIKDIIRDIINNTDSTFLVKSLYTMSSFTGSFIADGIFSHLMNILLAKDVYTYYTTPRKLLIIEPAKGTGKALSFNGSSYSTMDNEPFFDMIDRTTAWSISVVAKLPSEAVTRMIYAKTNTVGDNGFSFWKNTSDQFVFSLSNVITTNEMRWNSSTSTSDGLPHRWLITHAAGTGASSEFQLYKDGVTIGSASVNNLNASPLNNLNFVVGAESDGGLPLANNSYVDTLRFYNAQLTASQALDEETANANLVAEWLFNGDMKDSKSSLKITGTITGTEAYVSGYDSDNQKINQRYYQIDTSVNTKTVGGAKLGGTAGVFTPYKISDNKKDDSILLNDLTLIGFQDIKYRKKTISAGDNNHAYRINTPQITNATDLQLICDAIVTSSNVINKSYMVEIGTDISNIRYNTGVGIFNNMIGLSLPDVKVEMMELSYPDPRTKLYINQHDITYFDLVNNDIKILSGVTSKLAT